MRHLELLLKFFPAFLASFCADAGAAVNPATAVVQVRSGICESQAAGFHGSGLLIRSANRVFVLTSEHVVLHGNSPYCHYVSNPAIGALPADLKIADWGSGLALLEIRNPLALARDALPLLSDFSDSGLEAGDQVRVTGVPYSSSRFFDDSGTVLDPQSRRALIPFIPSVIEIDHAHGEYGMSGGPALSSDRSRIVGVLSHQFMKMVPGIPTQVGEFSSRENTIQNHLVLIPARAAKDWIERYLAAPTRDAGFVRDPEDQLAGREAVYSGGLQFSWLPVQPDGKLSVPQTDAAQSRFDALASHAFGNLGGTRLSNFGNLSRFRRSGGDGAGVGGGEDPEILGAVGISLDPRKHASQWAIEAKLSFYNRAKDLSERRHAVISPFLLEIRESGASIEQVPARSLSQFFWQLSQTQEIAGLLTESSGDATGELLGLESKLATACGSSSPSTLQFLNDLGSIGRAEIALGPDVVKQLPLIEQARQNPAWSELFNCSFDDTVQLKAALEKLQ